MAFVVVSAKGNRGGEAVAEAERRSQAFAAARRHSILVQSLRFVLKVCSLGGVLMMVFVGFFQHLGKPIAGLSGSGLGIEGTKVTMDGPKLTGFRKDGRPYLVNAAKAMQDASHPTIVELSDIDANLATSDNTMVKLTARTGVYDTLVEHLDVVGNVSIKSKQYDVSMKSASIDFKNGRYISKEAVTIVTSSGMKIDADSLSANDSERELQFDGNVRSFFQPAVQDELSGAPLNGAAQ